jgi:ubiquinone/menaquinone biosynthesis C-methylase UbiE
MGILNESIDLALRRTMDRDKEAVAEFWEREACGERYGDEQEAARYALEPEILAAADFPSGKDRKVLEIGVGMGADLVRWARAGADVVGVDLTERAVQLTSERLRREGLPGHVRVADAEALPFDDASFDIVWSWGVLHHTPDADQALVEAARVVKPGGRYAVMVYHRRSWLALAAWARFALLKGRPFQSIGKAVAHVESPGTRAYTCKELTTLLGPSLDRLRVRPVLTHWDRRVAPGLASLTGDRFGWFLLVEGVRR